MISDVSDLDSKPHLFHSVAASSSAQGQMPAKSKPDAGILITSEQLANGAFSARALKNRLNSLLPSATPGLQSSGKTLTASSTGPKLNSPMIVMSSMIVSKQ